jgi:hypothetical protein
MLEPCWLASGQQPTILDDSEQYLRARGGGHVASSPGELTEKDMTNYAARRENIQPAMPRIHALKD